MAERGEKIVKKPCSSKTIKTYRYNIERFYQNFPKLIRANLSGMLEIVEKKETRSRDYYWSKYHMYCSILSLAKYFMHKGFETSSLLTQLEELKPTQKVKNRSVRWPEIEQIHLAADSLQAHKTKKKGKVYSDYNAVLNETLIYFHRWTAARASEIANVGLCDIDWREVSVDLDGKGGKWRPIGLNKKLVACLRAYLKIRPKGSSTDKLFVSDRGTPLCGNYISRRIRRAGKWIGVVMSSHDLRRASLTDMLTEKGLDLATVRDIAGHVDFRTTNKYIKPTRKKVIDAMKNMI